MKLATALFILLISATATAQITITKDDYSFFSTNNGVTNYSASGVNGTTYDLKGAGSGLTWDFSGLTFTQDFVFTEYVEPSATPFANTFPTATHSVKIVTQQTKSYLYLRLADEALYHVGISSQVQGQDIIRAEKPEKPTVIFPASLGTSWNYDGESVSVTQSVENETDGEYSIDATGTVILPGGQFECVRKKSVEYITSKVLLNGQVSQENVSKSVQYSFITKNGVNVSVVVDTNDENSTNPTVVNISYTVSSPSTSNADIETPTRMEVLRLYPNPVVAGESAHLSMNVPTASNISVKVFDLRGVEMASIFNGYAGQGAMRRVLNTSGLTPGIYFIRMTANGKVYNKPLSIIR